MYKNKLLRAAAIPAVAVAAVALTAPAALAQTDATYTVTAGSATTADNPVGWTATSGEVSFEDTDAGLPMTCDSSTAKGDVTVGTGISSPVGHINSISWTGCQGLGIDLTVTASGLPWNVDGTDATAGGVTPGEIEPIQAHVVDTGTNGTVCSFDVEGSASGSYTNGSQTLSVAETGDTLIIRNPAGTLCGPLLLDGDHASYEADYVVVADNADFNPIQIN